MCNCNENIETNYSICNPEPCSTCSECAVKDLSTDCILYTEDTIQCQNTNVVLKNTVLSIALKNIVDFFCLKLSEIANRFRIVNIGLGAKVYKQENLLGQKELRTILSSDTSIIITEGTTTIDITVPDYPVVPTASNVGIGAGVFKELSANDYKFRKIKTENSGAGATILKAQVENINDISIIAKTLTSIDSSLIITTSTDTINLSVTAGVVYSAGTAMSLVGTTFNNTAPDQTVSLTQGGATTITGSYPNFTITSSDTNTIADGSETKVNGGSNITITGTGTTLNPYIVNGQYSPLEAIDEGNGIGYVIRGRNALNFGNIGWDSIDFSTSTGASSTRGATGDNSIAIGEDVITSGFASGTIGNLINNDSQYGFATGINLTSSGQIVSLLGVGHNVTGQIVTVVGQAANIIVGSLLTNNEATKALFVVGNGTIQDADINYTALTRSDAFIVRINGVATLPSVTNALITAEATGKAVVTREYLESVIPTSNIKIATITYNAPSMDTAYNIATGIIGGTTMISVTPFFECITANNGYVPGDRVTGQTPEVNDGGGLVDSGIGVKFKTTDLTEVVFSINNRIDINVSYTGLVGTSGAIGNPIGHVTLADWAVKLVILYI